VATVLGHTDRAASVAGADGGKIRALGGVMRLRFDDDELGITVKNELGFASWLGDAGESNARTFSFNADYKVGLILFDQVLARISARQADQAFVAGASPSVASRYYATQGAVSNASYMNPVVRVRLDEALDLRLGWLIAYRTGEMADPYSASPRLAGGRALGHELDASMRLKFRIEGPLYGRIGVEGGIFWAGPALDGVAGDALGRVTLLRLLGDLTF
jgi:hypothetical protein